jgi:hypothetical protein
MADDIPTTSLEVLLETAEALLHENEDLLRYVPLLGTAYKVACLGKSISDRIFLCKLQRFVGSIATISSEERAAFMKRLDGNPEQLRKVGETIVLAINKLDDMEKPELLGKIFRAYVRGVITNDQFRRLTAAVDAALVSDLLQFGITGSKDNPVLKNLMGTGLTTTGTTALTATGQPVFNTIVKTEIGEVFQKLYRDQT